MPAIDCEWQDETASPNPGTNKALAWFAKKDCKPAAAFAMVARFINPYVDDVIGFGTPHRKAKCDLGKSGHIGEH
jgi:hypothetical protein